MQKIINFKKYIIGFALILMIALCPFMLFACGESTPDPKPNGIEINSTFKTEYYVEEELDVSGGILDYTKDGKTIQVVIEPTMITGFSNQTAGTRNMVITYADLQSEDIYTLTVKYTIKEIPDFPLDTTGTVQYKSTELLFGNNNQPAGMMFRLDALKLEDYTENMEFMGSQNPYNVYEYYSRTFNKKTGSWEILSKSQYGSYLKLTNITANSFTLEIYFDEESQSSTATDPTILPNAIPLETGTFVKVNK